MRTSMSSRRLDVLVVMSTALFSATCLPVLAEEQVSWLKAEGGITRLMLAKDANYVALVESVLEEQPKTGQEAMFKVCVLMRTGMTNETIGALEELKDVCPELDNRSIGYLYSTAFDRYQAYDVATSTVELFASTISSLTLSNRLYEHFDRSGKSPKEVDRWLASMPGGINEFWAKERLIYNAQRGLEKEYLEELTNQVQANPGNVQGVITYLEILLCAHHYLQNRQIDLAWMLDAVKPQSATEAMRLASKLQAMERWSEAATYYGQAVKIPLASEDRSWLSTRSSLVLPQDKQEAMFASHVRNSLSECLLKMNRATEAQDWMIEASDIRQKYDLPLNALFAGRVQRASGQRTIQDRIRDKEEGLKLDPEYWLERSRYYEGRNEPLEEEMAYKEGLSVAPVQSDNKHSQNGSRFRSSLISRYARFLDEQNRSQEGAALLLNELKQAPADSRSSQSAAYRLCQKEYKGYIKLEDPVLWNWLSNREKWESTEQDLLTCMLTRPRAIRPHYVRAEAMCFDQHPSRACSLGQIMLRTKARERSIPLLRYALKNTNERSIREQISFALFESYLALRNWKQAESIFPTAIAQLSVYDESVPSRYSQVAVMAAQSGAKTDAMRIWRQIWNLCPAHLAGLEDLASAGLRKELEAFYRHMSKIFPTSNVPARALRILAG